MGGVIDLRATEIFHHHSEICFEYYGKIKVKTIAPAAVATMTIKRTTTTASIFKQYKFVKVSTLVL